MSERIYEISMDTQRAVALWVALRHRAGALDGSAQLAADENFAVYLCSERDMINQMMEQLEAQFAEVAPFDADDPRAVAV